MLGRHPRNHGNEWVINEDAYATLRNYEIFKKIEAVLMKQHPSYLGAYLLVNSVYSKYIYETFDGASRDHQKYGFIGRMGMEGLNFDILMLGALQKPLGFDNIAKK